MRILLTALFLAQATAPSFEVASVTPHPLASGIHVVRRSAAVSLGAAIAGNRVTIRPCSLKLLIMLAYDVKDFQITGVPAALSDDQLYDIAAKTEGEATPAVDQVRLMLQTLLADRFQLELHRETKEVAVYDLVVAKSGPKLKESAGPKRAENPVTDGPMMRWSFSDRTIPGLIDLIAPRLDRPVVDKTGLTGRYDFTFDIPAEHPEEIVPAIESLGLKLTSAKEPAEILVIDHASKPSAN
jgi:uncharacterized protein (TIGR03435 family)